MNPEQVASLIRAAMPDATVEVRSDDNTHFAARVVSGEDEYRIVEPGLVAGAVHEPAGRGRFSDPVRPVL